MTEHRWRRNSTGKFRKPLQRELHQTTCMCVYSANWTARVLSLSKIRENKPLSSPLVLPIPAHSSQGLHNCFQTPCDRLLSARAPRSRFLASVSLLSFTNQPSLVSLFPLTSAGSETFSAGCSRSLARRAVAHAHSLHHC